MQRCFQGIVICNVGTYYCYPVFNDIRPGQGGCRTRHRLASCVSVWFRCSQVMMMMMMTKNDDDNLGFRTSQLLGYSALADINLMAERDAARRAWAASRSVADRREYRRLRNHAKLMLSRARRSHLTESLCSDARRFWSRLRQYGADFSARGSKCAPPPDQDALSADQLNQHFAGVGARVAAEASRAARDAGACDAGPRPYKVCAGAFAPHCVSLPDLILTVSRLSASRAVGVDGIPITAIRSCLPAVGPLILHLVNFSISTLTFPDSWKVAIVTPIHKSGDQKHPGNFRPISILPSLSKILEKVVCSQRTSYLITNQILSPSQYAYRPSHSTEDAVLDIVEWAARSVDVGEVASLTSIDLSNRVYRCQRIVWKHYQKLAHCLKSNIYMKNNYRN